MNLDPEYLVNMKDMGFGGFRFRTVAGSIFKCHTFNLKCQ